MRGIKFQARNAGLALAGALALSLAGCGTSLDPTSSVGGSLLAFNTPNAPPIPAAAAAAPDNVDCPHIEVLEGASALRIGGEGNGGVRYQYSLGDLARECTVVGKQISIKVGVQGHVLLGPAGAPGTFSVPVRIVVRSEKDQKPAASKFYRSPATIPAGETQTDFTVISEPLLVPLTRWEANEDYTILVGFDQAGGGAVHPAARRKNRR